MEVRLSLFTNPRAFIVPEALIDPFTSRVYEGELQPIPTRPLQPIKKACKAVAGG